MDAYCLPKFVTWYAGVKACGSSRASRFASDNIDPALASCCKQLTGMHVAPGMDTELSVPRHPRARDDHLLLTEPKASHGTALALATLQIVQGNWVLIVPLQLTPTARSSATRTCLCVFPLLLRHPCAVTLPSLARSRGISTTLTNKAAATAYSATDAYWAGLEHVLPSVNPEGTGNSCQAGERT